MTEIVDCPACCMDVPVEIENVEGDSISVDCKTCGASLKVAYKIAEIETDVIVEKAPPASFECPECGGEMEVEDLDERGSDELNCEYCPVSFEVEWSDWGHSVDYIKVLK